MIKDALELLQSTAVDASGAQHLVDSADGRQKHYVLKGERFAIDVGPPLRNHVVDSLEDLIKFAEKEAGDFSVWHCDDAVTLICDHTAQRDTVRFLLPFSRPFKTLYALDGEAGNHFDQRAFIRLLHRTLGVDSATVAKFRRLDFKVIQAAEGEHQHGKDRLGQSVHAEVKGTSDLPGSLVVNVPVYDAAGERDTEAICCSIDLDPQRSQIIFEPVPGELSLAIESRQASIRERLTAALDEEARVYSGQPVRS